MEGKLLTLNISLNNWKTKLKDAEKRYEESEDFTEKEEQALADMDKAYDTIQNIEREIRKVKSL